MAEAKKDLKIRFAGRLDNLVINYGGKVLYSYKREKKRDMGKTEKQIAAQSKTAITAAFCSQINKIPALKSIWSVWPDNERKPYRNMLAANMLHALPERLTVKNMMSPKSIYDYPNFCKSIDSSGMEIVIENQSPGTIETETGKTFSVIVIICMFNPIDRTKRPYRLFSICKELNNFNIMETYSIKITFDAEEQKEVSAFGNSIIYSTIVFNKLNGSSKKWVSTYPKEFELGRQLEEEVI